MKFSTFSQNFLVLKIILGRFIGYIIDISAIFSTFSYIYPISIIDAQNHFGAVRYFTVTEISIHGGYKESRNFILMVESCGRIQLNWEMRRKIKIKKSRAFISYIPTINAWNRMGPKRSIHTWGCQWVFVVI